MAKKPPSKTTLTRKCDEVWSKLVRALGYCERCGKTGRLEAAHVVTRSNRRLRHDPRNGMSLCGGCHRWAHAYPMTFGAWFRDHRPLDAAYIEEVQNEISHYTAQDYADRLADLRSELELVEARHREAA